MSRDFDPKRELMEIKGKPYLPAHSAIAWFRKEFPLPQGQIVTQIVDLEKSILRCEIFVDEILVSSADVRGDGVKSLEKLQTNSIRRALAFAGYGTVLALAHEDDEQSDESSQAKIAMAMAGTDKEQVRRSLGASGSRRIGERPEEPTGNAAQSMPEQSAMFKYMSYVGKTSNLVFCTDENGGGIVATLFEGRTGIRKWSGNELYTELDLAQYDKIKGENIMTDFIPMVVPVEFLYTSKNGDNGEIHFTITGIKGDPVIPF